MCSVPGGLQVAQVFSFGDQVAGCNYVLRLEDRWGRAVECLCCARRTLGKRSEAVAAERLLFHMTDFPNCSKINLWQEREAAAAQRTGCLSGDTCLSGVSVMSDARVRTAG